MDNKPDLSGVPVVALESLRNRLSQLVLTLSELNAQVQAPELPPWPSVHKQFDVAATQLEYLVSNLESFAPQLQRAVAYPLPNFPHRTQEWLLTTLLRKKNLPEIDDWIQEGIEAGRDLDEAADARFSDFVMETTKEHVRVGVEQTTLAQPAQPQRWALDKVVGFLNGQPQGQ